MEIFTLHLTLLEMMEMWYHDGITTGSACENEGDIEKFSSKKLLRCRGKQLVLVVYERVGWEGGRGAWVVVLYIFKS